MLYLFNCELLAWRCRDSMNVRACNFQRRMANGIQLFCYPMSSYSISQGIGPSAAVLYMRMGLVKRRILECSSQYLGNNRRYGPDYWPDMESHTGCRLIPVLMTLNDRELSENEHIGAYYQRQKDSHMSVNVKTARTGTSRSNGGVISPDSRSIPNSRFSTNYVNNRLTESRI